MQSCLTVFVFLFFSTFFSFARFAACFLLQTGVSPDNYLDQQRIALTELLTNYGPVRRLWWDNYALDGSKYQPVTHSGFVCPNNQLSPACPNWNVLINIVRSLQPSTLIVPGPDGCLVNAERPGGTYPAYFGAPQGSYWCTNANNPMPGGANFTFMNVEADFSIYNPGDYWFWGPKYPVLSVGDLWGQVTLKHGQGSNLILNVGPDDSGAMPPQAVAVLAAYRQIYTSSYNVSVAALPAPVSGPCPGLSITLPVDPKATFDQLLTEEDMSEGQVVAAYTVEARAHGTGLWTKLPIEHGLTVGPRIRDWGLGRVTGVDRLRWNCTAGLAPQPATIRSFAAFLGATVPQ